jgi:GTP-binding protein
MPGYGYAAASKAKVLAWTALIHAYLQGRASLARVYVLIDSRHGLKDLDHEVMTALDRAAVSYQVVLTKTDQIGRSDLAARLEATHAALTRHPAAYPQVLATSSRSGDGMPELRAAIVTLLREKER